MYNFVLVDDLSHMMYHTYVNGTCPGLQEGSYGGSGFLHVVVAFSSEFL